MCIRDRSEWNGDDYGIGGGLYGWWIECEDYKYPEGGSCGGQVGHYTQYIRADTRFVGCGVTICPSGIATKTTTYSWANLNVVCNYYGGQYGDAPYEPATENGVGKASLVASNCDPDRTPNRNTGLWYVFTVCIYCISFVVKFFFLCSILMRLYIHHYIANMRNILIYI